MALIEKLNALGDAVREKAELTEKMTLDQMAEAISNLEVNPAPNVEEITIIENGTYTPDEGVDGFNKVIVDVPVDFGDLPEDLIHLTGNQTYKFRSDGWNSFLEKYGNQITTENLTDISHMFDTNSLKTIPFSLNMSKTSQCNFLSVFESANWLEDLPIITGGKLGANGLRYAFRYCYQLKEINMDFTDLDFTYLGSLSSGYEGNVNNYCYSIKEIPIMYYKKLKEARTVSKTYLYSPYYYLCNNCYNVGEIIDMPAMDMDNYTSNAFNSSFTNAYRLKDFIFEVQEDGTPYVASKWKSQTIDLSPVGYCQLSYTSYKRDNYLYNSGISIDKCIYDDATYQALKNDPDNYVCGYSTEKPHHYSRYDKASAIRTINSLPDVSGSGGTNTIKFKGEAGLKTDNGAINTMTPEEVAVATAKGWTVSFI